jgi:hypothetical protein
MFINTQKVGAQTPIVLAAYQGGTADQDMGHALRNMCITSTQIAVGVLICDIGSPDLGCSARLETKN